MSKLIEGILWAVGAQIISFYQMQGQYLWEFAKKNIWFAVLLGMPISFMFIKSVQAFVTAYDGQIWPSRLIGFGVGVIIFTILSQLLFSEGLSLKTISCLILGLGIIFIQIYWK